MWQGYWLAASEPEWFWDCKYDCMGSPHNLLSNCNAVQSPMSSCNQSAKKLGYSDRLLANLMYLEEPEEACGFPGIWSELVAIFYPPDFCFPFTMYKHGGTSAKMKWQKI